MGSSKEEQLDFDVISLAGGSLEQQVDRLYKENEHFISSTMCIEGDYLDHVDNKEYAEVSEQVEGYLLQEKLDATLQKWDEDDNKSIYNQTEAGTDIASLKDFLGR